LLGFWSVKGEGEVLSVQTMKACVEAKTWFQFFLTWALDGGEKLASLLAKFTPRP